MQELWTTNEIPDLSHRYAVVTGASRQRGRMIIERLSDHGAHVFAVSRDELGSDAFGPDVEPVRMNPTSMESIHNGAERIRSQVPQIDLLIHAASISIAPRFRSAEGHGLMVATNYLGFVLLSHELAPAMRSSDSARVVLAGSGEPLDVDLDLDHLDAEEDMDWAAAYAHSRLAAMMFALELNSRAGIRDSALLSTIAEAHEPDTYTGTRHTVRHHLNGLKSRIMGEPKDAAVLPVLYASTSGDVEGGQYYDTRDRARARVEPNPAKIPDVARRPDLRAELWQRTEHLLGLHLEVA